MIPRYFVVAEREHELRNATPYLFDETDLRRGIAGIRRVLAAR